MKSMLSISSNTKRKLVLGGAVAAVSLLVSPVLQAQPYSDNWNDGSAIDANPLYWVQTGSSGTKTWTFPVNPADSTLAYKLNRTTAGTIMSLLGNPAAPGGLQPAPTFVQQVDVIDWDNNPAYGTAFGLVGRLDAVTSTGYGLLIRNPTGGSATSFRINRFDPGGILTAIATGNFVTPITPAGDYRLVFSAQGTTLTGQIFDNATGLPVPLSGGTGVSGDGSYISVTDSTYTTGMYGVGALYVNNNAVTATFDNYMMVVPEPSALALAGLGLASLLTFRRRSS
jgi:hypothetical protein